MRPSDSLKALVAAIAILVLNLLLTTAAMFVYAGLVAPGHPESFYQAMAPKVAGVTAPEIGAALNFLAAYVLGRRRPQRNPIAFAAAMVGAYVVIDAVSGLVSAGPVALATPVALISMGLSIVAALAGGFLAKRRSA
jgi:hypothetical protein